VQSCRRLCTVEQISPYWEPKGASKHSLPELAGGAPQQAGETVSVFRAHSALLWIIHYWKRALKE
jgi:hypothetical protein